MVQELSSNFEVRGEMWLYFIRQSAGHQKIQPFVKQATPLALNHDVSQSLNRSCALISIQSQSLLRCDWFLGVLSLRVVPNSHSWRMAGRFLVASSTFSI
jgi:hypothetical protein